MSSFKMSIPHQLPQQEALGRIKNMLKQLQEEQSGNITGVREKWEDANGQFQFSTRGFNLSGSIKVLPNQVELDAKLPFALGLFQSKIKQVLDKKTRELLS